MKKRSGIELLDERRGEGTEAAKGDRVVFNTRFFLNKGDEVPLNERQAAHVPVAQLRVVDNVTLIDRTVTLGRRQTIAGVEYALAGMSVGGYRKLRIGPHLAYRDKGVPGLVPAGAVLVVELWLRDIQRGSSQ
ncbi:MAG: FKBP-type peptidyl-prolyl cis-trans isomerase [Alphaproteobacteria bacterium]|nr:FKBP-type peptidyl-prolyl cis-trans isomerase [Alphaproteobacteria bacterium]